MNDYLKHLKIEFQNNASPEIAGQQKAYLRNKFEFFGIKTVRRREIQKPFLVKSYLPDKDKLAEIVKHCWKQDEREFHYFAQELVFKYFKNFEEPDIEIFEYMVTNKSWWDTVDFIAVKLIGNYFQLFPELREKYVSKWIDTNNIWLQRSALLFQLKYKDGLDIKLLSSTIESLLGSDEFFINKAIGWILREYSRTNPDWVAHFVENTNLENLSRREALKLIR